jgi:carbon monoxide dehydrogenase subunit G
LNGCPLKNILCCRAINDKGGIGEMLNMSQVNDIKDLAREGKRIGEISKKLKVDPNGKTAQAFDALIREVTKKGIL